MKPVEQDEMFPEASSSTNWDDEVANEGVPLPKVCMDSVNISVSEKGVHTDFYNSFDDLFDDDDLA